MKRGLFKKEIISPFLRVVDLLHTKFVEQESSQEVTKCLSFVNKKNHLSSVYSHIQTK